MDRDLACGIGNLVMVTLRGDLLGYPLRMDRDRPHRYRHSELARGCGASLDCLWNPSSGSSHFVCTIGLHHRFGDDFALRHAGFNPPRGDGLSGGSSIGGSFKNSLIAIGVFIGIWLVTSPLWLIGAGVLVPFIAATYLNQRLFRYDALSEHANPEEMKALIKAHRSSWWALGFLTGLIQFVPILNLFAPALTGLTYIHFGLARLSELRHLTPVKNNLSEP